MKHDLKVFGDRCIVCNFVKGQKRHRAPLNIRELTEPRMHIIVDFIGKIFDDYFILAIIDYCTGWTMLVPCKGNDTQVVVHSLLTKWYPIFGLFKFIDSDYGPGFDSNVFRWFMSALGTDVQYAEPNYHRGIGKVERIIQFVQTMLQRYNIQLNEYITNDKHYEVSDRWRAVKVLLPHIQIAINQRIPRFTNISPNMLMFGQNMMGIDNMDVILERFKQNHNKNMNNSAYNKADYSRVQSLLKQLTKIYDKFKHDWQDYTWLSKQQYNERYNIKQSTLNRNKRRFKEGVFVLYYVGDLKLRNYKWRRKWTGPWLIKIVLNDSTVIIADTETGNLKRVSIDRLKEYKAHNSKDYYKYTELMKDDGTFEEYQDSLRKILHKHDNKGIVLVNKDDGYNFDYRKSRNHQNSQ